ADRNRSHWSTSKTPSYTKSVSWHHYLHSLADQGLLMNFVGMLTDSRSLVSYTRHDYFRRILCNIIGGWVERGEVPDNNAILTKMVKNICHDNAENYFRF
ncbi:glucuronate isomerase, partial [Enterobacter hormaechei]|uniref:glucuronate isomerase n=1 Tax=Enterobacter hormaechei TaxID=158836 RepID=UPI003356D812